MQPSTPKAFSLSTVARKLGLVVLGASACAAAGSFASNIPVMKGGVGVAAQGSMPAGPAHTGGRAAGHAPSPTSPSVSAPEAKPLWKDLTPEQQQSLKPLAANWTSLSDGQKRKWIALSRNFPAKTAAEQAKLHSRMTEWVSLSQQQRTQARLNFAETKTLSGDEKAAQWKAYQALSPEEKQKLAAKGAPPLVGATNTVKPVPEQRLAKVPTTRRNPPVGTMAAHNTSVDANTLLPLAPTVPVDAITAPKN